MVVVHTGGGHPADGRITEFFLGLGEFLGGVTLIARLGQVGAIGQRLQYQGRRVVGGRRGHRLVGQLIRVRVAFAQQRRQRGEGGAQITFGFRQEHARLVEVNAGESRIQVGFEFVRSHRFGLVKY